MTVERAGEPFEAVLGGIGAMFQRMICNHVGDLESSENIYDSGPAAVQYHCRQCHSICTVPAGETPNMPLWMWFVMVDGDQGTGRA